MNENEVDGLKLNLKIRETCKEFLKPPGPVLATLHVSVSNGRRNDFTKCKELLTFLKEQVLPKTVKLISLKTIKKVKDEETRERVNLLSCMRPGKSKKRYVPSGGSRGGARGARASPLFWVKKEEMTEGRKAGSPSKIEPSSLLRS